MDAFPDLSQMSDEELQDFLTKLKTENTEKRAIARVREAKKANPAPAPAKKNVRMVDIDQLMAAKAAKKEEPQS